MNESYEQGFILSLFDISKFFDRENLIDVMSEAHKSGVKGKTYRLLFELNKETIIKVNTPLGETEEYNTGSGLGQGTVEGAILSSNNLDKGVEENFSDKVDIFYENVKIDPLLFQDDVASPASDLENAQENNDRMERVIESKLLDFNLEKSVFLVIGSHKFKKDIKNKLSNKPLLLCGKEMKQSEKYTYLGDELSDRGLSHSVMSTIDKRYGTVYKAIFEINIIISDVRSCVPGEFSTAMMLWNMSVLPALYSSAA